MRLPFQMFVDTGSTTTLIPLQDVNLASLGPSTGSGVYNFGTPEASTVVTYDTYTTSLNFGHGITTKPMTVGVITSETFNGMPRPPEAVLGVGANSTGSIPNKYFPTGFVQQLPGPLSEGILVNETQGYFQFGPNSLTPFAAVSGAPVTNQLFVVVNGGTPGNPLGAYIDTGGVNGSIPTSLAPGLSPGDFVPAGTTIQVVVPNPSTPNGLTLLYTETVGANAMQVTTGAFNTGNYVFTQMPIYFSYSPSGVGTTIFDKVA